MMQRAKSRNIYVADKKDSRPSETGQGARDGVGAGGNSRVSTRVDKLRIHPRRNERMRFWTCTMSPSAQVTSRRMTNRTPTLTSFPFRSNCGSAPRAWRRAPRTQTPMSGDRRSDTPHPRRPPRSDLRAVFGPPPGPPPRPHPRGLCRVSAATEPPPLFPSGSPGPTRVPS
jgi:hypothetical protein